MSDLVSTPTSTPKRKRSNSNQDRCIGLPFPASAPASSPASLLNFSFRYLSPTESIWPDGSTSPRLRMAQRLGSLALDGPSVHPPPLIFAHCGDGNAVDEFASGQKRQWLQRPHLEHSFDSSDRLTDSNSFAPPSNPLNCPLRRSRPSINRRPCSLSRRRLAGTPPLISRTNSQIEDRYSDGNASDHEPSTSHDSVADRFTGSLTWHHDEITIYDPDDSGDDGTGINGIGFKPTPAIARARASKRMQQLAKYRQREEVEARDKWRQNRQVDAPQLGSPARKVRFIEFGFEPKTSVLAG